MTEAERSYRIVQITRRLMLAEGIDPNTNDAAEFYHGRPDVQLSCASQLENNQD